MSVSDDTLRALSDELIRIGRRRATDHPSMQLDASAFKILWLVVETGPQTLRTLADHLQLEQSTINRQVHAAIDHGLVERYADPDCSGLRVRATAEGERSYRHDAQLRADGLRSVVEAIGQQRAARLASDLAALNDAIDQAVARLPATAAP